MKTHEILYEEHHYDILSVERNTTPSVGSFKQGNITVNYQDLEKLFGHPENHFGNDKSDVNISWNLLFKYRDPLNDEHIKYNDFDHIEVSIYDYRRGTNQHYVDPTTISNWTVGAKSREGLWILTDYLESKGL